MKPDDIGTLILTGVCVAVLLFSFLVLPGLTW